MSTSTSLSVNKNGFTRTNFAWQNLHGFTLIELLVVISILAVLSVVGLVSFQGVRDQANKARMKADVDAIRKAYEVNFDPSGNNGQGEYKPLTAANFASGKIPTPDGTANTSYIVIGPDPSANVVNRGLNFAVCVSLSDGSRCLSPSPGSCYCASSTQGAPFLSSSSDPYGVLVISNGLVGYWKMDDNVSGDAKTLADSSNTKTNNGITHYGVNTTGMDCTVAGKYGEGCNMDGIDDYVSIASLSPTSSSPVSVFGWVYPTDNSTARCLISRNQAGWFPVYMFCPYVPTGENDDRTNGAFGLYMQDTRSYGSNLIVYSDAALPLNTWSHIGFTYDGTAFTLYYNGQPTNKTLLCKVNTIDNPCTEALTYLSSTGNQKYYIGAGRGFATDDPGRYFAGQIDEIRIYNRTFSPAEVSALYNFRP